MNIVCATDNNYIQHCGVMLTSLFENNRLDNIHIYLLTEGLSDKNKLSLKQIIESYDGYFHYCKIDSLLIKNCPIKETDHLSLATYYRLLIPWILPESEFKTIYLDCDIVVESSLIELWQTDISDYAIAGVDELGTHCSDVFERLKINSNYGYFNAGVLLINIAYWRKHEITDKCFEYMKEHRIRIIAHDQDILNALLYDKCLHLDCRWNMEEAFYHVNVVDSNKQILNLSTLSNPSIIHYTWKPKPWEPECNHPFKKNYYKYLRLTEWKNFKPQFNLRVWFYCFRRDFYIKMGIKQSKYCNIHKV